MPGYAKIARRHLVLEICRPASVSVSDLAAQLRETITLITKQRASEAITRQTKDEPCADSLRVKRKPGPALSKCWIVANSIVSSAPSR